MRSLALLLLLANIIFLGWQLSWLPSWLPWQPSDFIKDVPSEEPPVSDLPHLVLLNESHSVSNVASALASDKISHGQVSTDNPSKTNGLAPVEAVEVKEGDEKPTATEGKELLTGKMTPVYNNDASIPEKHRTFENGGAPRESADTHQNRQDVNPVKNVEKMSMDSTTGGATHTVAASSKPPAPELENTAKPKNSPLAEEVKVAPAAQAPIKVVQASVKKASSMTCFKAGPYMPLTEAKKVADWLKNQEKVSVEVKHREIPVSTKTWVYLPSLGSRQAATRVVQRLTQQGVTGQAIEPNNAISLGVFGNKENVVRRVKELQAKGYNEVKTEEHHENETTYWLSVKIADNPKSILSAFGKRFKEGLVPEEGTCE